MLESLSSVFADISVPQLALLTAMALVASVVGGVALPGAFLAKALIERLPLHVHTTILDAVVIGGGVAMVVNAFVR